MDKSPIDSRCQQEAAKYGVHPFIHPDDFLFSHIGADGKTADPVGHYFADGRHSAETLRDIIAGERGRDFQHFSLLDFASGYGMVARHYPVVLPHADATTCDIHPPANAFNAEHLPVKTLQSASSPEDLHIEQSFDVVFALSFFSHVSFEAFPKWLGKLYACVKKGGLFIFTTHGSYSSPPTHIRPDDHIFIAQSEQKDLDTRLYGITWTSPTYVIRHLKSLETDPVAMKIALFREGHWWDHQDLFVIARR